MTVHPDCAAMQKVTHPPPQRLPQLSRAPGQITRDVNDDLRIEPGNPLAEIPGRLLRSTVHIDTANALPRRIRPIRLFQTAADADYVESCLHQPRCQIRPNVPGTPYNCDAHAILIPAGSILTAFYEEDYTPVISASHIA